MFPKIVRGGFVYDFDNAIAGDRMGYMKYGTLLLEIEKEIDSRIDIGDKIVGGESIIGEIK